MRFLLQFWLVVACATTAAAAAPSIDLEIATESGLQITAPQEWLQLLTAIGIRNVRIRSAGDSDQPAVTNRGTPAQPSYHVVAILTTREQLRLPGGSFGRGDMKRLKDYFDRLAADGGERLTAPTTLFGLTEQELVAVLSDLAQPVGFDTKGQSPRSVLDRLQAKLKYRFSLEPAAEGALQSASVLNDELRNLSAGTAAAILLRRQGLALQPEKPRGQPLHYRIVPIVSDNSQAPLRNSAAQKTPASQPRPDDRPGNFTDLARKTWPVGWEIEKRPGDAAPSLFEQLNAEIDGFTLEETLAAVGPRLKVPYYLDHAAMTDLKIDSKAVQIRIPSTRISYKRLLDRVFAQARLGCEIRADEAGTVFLWISR